MKPKQISIRQFIMGILLTTGSLFFQVYFFAWVIGWTSFSLFFFWLILLPLSLYLVPAWKLQGFWQFLCSLCACLLFYTGVFLFIYKDYQDQFNTIIFVGLIVSLLSIFLLFFFKKRYPKLPSIRK